MGVQVNYNVQNDSFIVIIFNTSSVCIGMLKFQHYVHVWYVLYVEFHLWVPARVHISKHAPKVEETFESFAFVKREMNSMPNKLFLGYFMKINHTFFFFSEPKHEEETETQDTGIAYRCMYIHTSVYVYIYIYVYRAYWKVLFISYVVKVKHLCNKCYWSIIFKIREIF